MEAIKGYQIKRKKHIEELNAEGYILIHEKTGARVCLIECEDENKVFNIGFPTPPINDCGTTHIIEHTVLCGSKKYPAKDPFVELCKGSLNTFLNAMTYPEKTIYPVASCNDADFQNLMSVYMDAVFYPNIYQNRMIFEQEGWHYELDSPEGELKYNGVVYNEMKGAFSQADSVLDRYTRHTLFPDTPYGFESGGDPANIPDLTYDMFLDFHSKYYHPSNAYIYLYGNMDMAEKLKWIDEEYLSKYDHADYDMASKISEQQPFDEMKDLTIEYGISEEEEEAESAYLSWNKVIGSCLDTREVYAMQILDYVLLSSPGAVLRKALSQKGIGQDVYGGLEAGTKQTYFSVVARGADLSQKQDFVETIETELQKLVDQGLNKKSLMAGIVSQEFISREADFGRYPKGLILGLNLLDTWIHDEDAAFSRLEYNDVFTFLKDQVETDYFEKLIADKLLNHTFGAVVCAAPRKGLTEEKEAETARKLEAYKKTLSPEELQAIIEHTRALKAYQEEPTPKEALETIPMIHISDIRREATKDIWEEKEAPAAGVKVIQHDVFTSGIAYLNFCFDGECISLEDYPYLSVFSTIFGLVDTEHFTYEELPDEANITCGGMGGGIASYHPLKETFEESNRRSRTRFEVTTKVLYGKMEEALKLMAEIIHTSDLTQTDRILELLRRYLARAEQRFMSSGHSAAINRAFSYRRLDNYLSEMTDGISFYRFVTDLVDHFDERKEMLVGKLQEISRKLFRKENLFISITADDEGCRKCMESLPVVLEVLGDNHEDLAVYDFHPEAKNEGFTSSMQISFSAQCGNFKEAGFRHAGAMRVLTVSLNYNYLWTKLRVQGGAYGCMCGFSSSGNTYFASYRDPEVGKTYDVFATLPDYLRNFEADEMEMEKNIIGAIAEMDIPMTPAQVGHQGFVAYMIGGTQEKKQRARDSVLNATVEDIRALADPVEAVLKQNCICTIGNQGKVEADSQRFKKIEALI